MQSFLQRRSLKRLERPRSQSSSLIPPLSKWVSLGSHLEPRHSCICLFGVQEAGFSEVPPYLQLWTISIPEDTAKGVPPSHDEWGGYGAQPATLPTLLSRSDSGSASQHQRVCFEHRCVLEWSNGRILLLIFFFLSTKEMLFFFSSEWWTRCALGSV